MPYPIGGGVQSVQKTGYGARVVTRKEDVSPIVIMVIENVRESGR